MESIITNPSITFFESYESDINRVRESLFSELDGISSKFGVEARNLLKEKLKSNKDKPLLGELFPWIIKDLVEAETDSTHQISVGWLAIYLYTLFLDEFVDDPKPISINKFMTGAALAKTGFLKLSRFTSNTAYEQYIDEAFSFSLYNQNLDVLFQKNTSQGAVKESYSAGKNYVLLSCAGALAAQNSKYGDFITKFSQSLLLSIQYLDDISDFREDFSEGNFTVLLDDVFKNNPLFQMELNRITNKELLEELIVTGALQRVINKTQLLLSQSINLIIENNLETHSKKSSIELFKSLQFYVSSFNIFLTNNSKHFRYFSQAKQKSILDKVEKYIAIIAQSS